MDEMSADEEQIFSVAWIGISGVKRVEHIRQGTIFRTNVILDSYGDVDVEEYGYEGELETIIVQPIMRCWGRGLTK